MSIFYRVQRAIAAMAMLATFSAAGQALAAPSAIYLVRHAEKSAIGQDPALTRAGQDRARMIAAMLRKAGIMAIYSTPTTRTRATAAPLAQLIGVQVELYDAGKPQALVDRVRASSGAVLVVGHSNTLPELVRLFGGAPGADIADDEFDRLYQLLPGADGQVKTILLSVPDPQEALGARMIR